MKVGLILNGMAIDVEVARRLLAEGQGSLTTQVIEAEGTPLDIAGAYHQVAKDLYWKDKDLAGARSALALGIAYAVDQARSTLDVDLAAELSGVAKAMCYDLASFCWPGWAEPGIEIGEAELECGEHAAAENLRLAIELERGDLPMANAHFMVGAYHLARRRHAYAEAAFQEFLQRATNAGEEGTALLAEGYLALVRRLDGTGDELDLVLSRLRTGGLEHGAFFADQLATAEAVFS
jgi:hypothetical protein